MAADRHVLVGIGGNLFPSRDNGTGLGHRSALRELRSSGLDVVACSRWYVSAPVPASGQPDHVNGVCRMRTALDPEAVLSLLHRVEAAFGRVRGAPGGARTLDLDLLAHGDTRADGPGLVLPHPRLAVRRFVLLPLADAWPDWVHPASGLGVAAMLAAAPRQMLRLARS